MQNCFGVVTIPRQFKCYFLPTFVFLLHHPMKVSLVLGRATNVPYCVGLAQVCTDLSGSHGAEGKPVLPPHIPLLNASATQPQERTSKNKGRRRQTDDLNDDEDKQSSTSAIKAAQW